MFLLIFGLFLLMVAFALPKLLNAVFGQSARPPEYSGDQRARPARPCPFVVRFLSAFSIALLGTYCVVRSTVFYVDDVGLVMRHFGTNLPDGHVIATQPSERGIQAKILTPGWSVGWFPGVYKCVQVASLTIPLSEFGVVTTADGSKSLPEGEVFAEAWDSAERMLDAEVFMKEGVRGPQLTILPPGKYFYNTALYSIQLTKTTDIPVGSVGVVKANAGPVPQATNIVATMNGVPLVTQGYRGVWADPLMPNAYNLHPLAYRVVMVQTSQRMYTYTSPNGSEANTAAGKEPEGDNSISVQTRDGYRFPVDVRVGVIVNATNAAYVVAQLSEPDADSDKDGFDNLEERFILPAVRSIMRNIAEDRTALEYVSTRSEIEAEGFKLLKTELMKFRIECTSFSLADFGLRNTPEGQALLQTQTNKQLAQEQETMYTAQVKAEKQRATHVTAKAEADMQEQLEKSRIQVEVEDFNAKAMAKKAEGDAAQSLVYKAKTEALGGPESFAKLETMRMLMEKLPDAIKGMKLPEVLVIGGNGAGGTSEGLMASLLAQFQNTTAPAKK